MLTRRARKLEAWVSLERGNFSAKKDGKEGLLGDDRRGRIRWAIERLVERLDSIRQKEAKGSVLVEGKNERRMGQWGSRMRETNRSLKEEVWEFSDS